jgi:hypothetical protein
MPNSRLTSSCDGRPDLPFLTELSEELALLVNRGPTGLKGADLRTPPIESRSGRGQKQPFSDFS